MRRHHLLLAAWSTAALMGASPAVAQTLIQDRGELAVPYTGSAPPSSVAGQTSWMKAGSIWSETKGNVWDPLGDALTGTFDLGTDAQDALDEIATNTGQELEYIPPTSPAAKGDTTYTTDFKNISTATDTVLISATSAQTGRLHWIKCTIAAAQTLIFKDGSTSKTATYAYPAAGGIFELELSPYAWVTTTANTALNLTTSTTAATACSYFYVKD